MVRKSSLPARARKSYGLSSKDERLLVDYLNRADGSSNFADMCRRAHEMRFTQIECPRCKRMRLKWLKPRPGGASKEFWETCGISPKELREQFPEWKPSPDCRRCGGLGKVEIRITRGMLRSRGITCFETKSSKHGRGADDSLVEKWVGEGAVSSRLEAIRARNRDAAIAMEMYWGSGDGCVSVLWGLTEAGRDLLAYRKKADHPVQQFFADEERRRMQGKTDHKRDKLCQRATEAAESLLIAAVQIWHDLGPDRSDGPPHEAKARSAAEEARQRVERLLGGAS